VFSQLQGQARTDSLLKELSTAKYDTTKVLIMLELSVSYLDTQKSLSLNYANAGLKLASTIGWKTGIGKSYAIKSLFYEETGKFDTAVIELQKALKIFEKSDNLEYQARINNNLANLYETLDNYPLSLEHHFKSLSINTKLGRQAGIAINYSNIGLVYWALQNDSLAFIYFQKALKIDKQLNRKTGLPAIYTNLGMYYQKKENDSLAIEHYFKSLELNTEINDKYGQSIDKSGFV
jgi:tetratricopeptide (TPR) repeat protein